MINYKWEILELFANNDELTKVRYLLSGNDGTTTVQSSGTHEFLPETVNKKLSDTLEANIIEWLEKDTTIDGINAIKLAIENQLNTLKNDKKVDFPWLAGTFTIE